MQVVSLVWGFLAFLGMIVGFLPCLGALNWLNIPFAAIGLVISIAALMAGGGTPRSNRPGAIVGLACCALAIAVGILRLTIGAGIV